MACWAHTRRKFHEIYIAHPSPVTSEAIERIAALYAIEAEIRGGYLFAGSNAGGERAAAIYTLLGSAKLNGLDPELYLQHVLQRIADQPISKLNDLLPWNACLQNHAQVA